MAQIVDVVQRTATAIVDAFSSSSPNPIVDTTPPFPKSSLATTIFNMKSTTSAPRMTPFTAVVFSNTTIQPELTTPMGIRSSPTSDPLKIFSFDFIDTKEFQDRVEDILAGREASRTTTSPPIINTEEDKGELSNSLSLLIPVAVFGGFMLFIGACVLWQVLRNRMQSKGHGAPAHSSFHRDHSGSEGSTRSSTKSTVKAQISLPTQKDFYPRLDRISESPEDRLKAPRYLYDHILSPDSSLTSILSQLDRELAEAMANNASMGITPITPYVHTPLPRMAVPAQAPYSPYHLTWMTPNTAGGPYQADPMGLRLGNISTRRTPPMFTDTTILDGRSNRNQTGKSPYHPNHNTPTNENDSGGALPSNVFVNQMNSMSFQQADLNNNSLKDSHSTSEPELPHNNSSQFITPSTLAYNRSASFGSATPSTECILSGPSNLGTWRYNSLYMGPQVGGPQVGGPQMGGPQVGGPQNRLFTNYHPHPPPHPAAAAMGIHASHHHHNASLSAMMGGRNSSMLQHVVGDLITGSCSVPDLPDLVGPMPCRSHPTPYGAVYQADMAAYLQYGFGHHYYPPAPPYSEAYLSDQAPHQPLSAASSINVSTCGHMDSLETSVSDSTMTGQLSNNTSGYTAGPSHSTSVMGTGHVLQVPSTNSSFISNSMSSILPLNSGATHNTPNTSFADSSFSQKTTSKEGLNDTKSQTFNSSQILRSTSHSELPSALLTQYTSSHVNPPMEAVGGATNIAIELLEVAPPLSEGNTSSTVTSLPYDEEDPQIRGDNNHSISQTTSSILQADNSNQSQHTTAPEGMSSLQWDSISVGTGSERGLTSMLANQGSQNVSTSSSNNAVVTGRRSSTELRLGAMGGATSGSGSGSGFKASSSTITTSSATSSEQTTTSSLRKYDWDGYPYYPVAPSRMDPRRRTIANMVPMVEPGNTGPLPPRPMQRRSSTVSYPVLASAQYWV